MSNLGAFVLGLAVAYLSVMWLLLLGYAVWRTTRKEDSKTR